MAFDFSSSSTTGLKVTRIKAPEKVMASLTMVDMLNASPRMQAAMITAKKGENKFMMATRVKLKYLIDVKLMKKVRLP